MSATDTPAPPAEQPELRTRPGRPAPRYDGALVERMCERVYRNRLGDDAARMVAKDQDGGEKLRRRAMAYEATVRATLEALDGEPLGASIAALLEAGQKMVALTSARSPQQAPAAEQGA